MKKKLLLPGFLVFAFLALAAAGGASVYAVNNEYPSIVQKIAEKFSLPENEVAAVFEEEREERRAEMYANFESRLSDAVTDGKITEEQKQAILAKHEEIHEKMMELANIDKAEVKEEMKALHDELKDWSEEQGIDLEVLRIGKKGIGRGYKTGHKFNLGL